MAKRAHNPIAAMLAQFEADDALAEREDTDFIQHNRHHLPSDVLRAGLQARNEQVDRDGGYDPHKKSWDYFLFDLDLKLPFAQLDRAQVHDLKAPRSQRHIPVSILHAYARHLGWRVIPGVTWACDITGDHDRAKDFIRACREWARDCDAVWRLAANAGNSRAVREHKTRLFRPLLASIRALIADMIEDLQRHPALAGAHFSDPDDIRHVDF